MVAPAVVAAALLVSSAAVSVAYCLLTLPKPPYRDLPDIETSAVRPPTAPAGPRTTRSPFAEVLTFGLIKPRYDDGGYSGGSTDRPDLQRLLDDIRAGKIDVIVVYKVDRLTRSLADFAKLSRNGIS